MDYQLVINHIQMIPILAAEEQIELANAVALGGGTMKDPKKYQRALERRANAKNVKKRPRPSPLEVAARHGIKTRILDKE